MRPALTKDGPNAGTRYNVATNAKIENPMEVYKDGNAGIGFIKGLKTNQAAVGRSSDRPRVEGRGLGRRDIFEASMTNTIVGLDKTSSQEKQKVEVQLWDCKRNSFMSVIACSEVLALYRPAGGLRAPRRVAQSHTTGDSDKVTLVTLISLVLSTSTAMHDQSPFCKVGYSEGKGRGVFGTYLSIAFPN